MQAMGNSLRSCVAAAIGHGSPRAFGFQKYLAFSPGSRTINPERGSIMARERITAVGEAAALLLSEEVLDKLGIAIGDEVELSLIDRTLMLQPPDEAARGQQLAAITTRVLARRQRAYTQLAQGPAERRSPCFSSVPTKCSLSMRGPWGQPPGCLPQRRVLRSRRRRGDRPGGRYMAGATRLCARRAA